MRYLVKDNFASEVEGDGDIRLPKGFTLYESLENLFDDNMDAVIMITGEHGDPIVLEDERLNETNHITARVYRAIDSDVRVTTGSPTIRKAVLNSWTDLGGNDDFTGGASITFRELMRASLLRLNVKGGQ